MEANKKRMKTHLVPTEISSNIYMVDGKLYYCRETHHRIDKTNQHLYFTSDDTPKNGDWMYKEDVKGKIYRHIPTTNSWYNDARKIEVSTDPQIVFPIPKSLAEYPMSYTPKRYPQPSQATIEAYCKNPFDECDVEMEIDMDNSMTEVINNEGKQSYIDHDTYIIKVDPNHNTVTTLKVVEKTYTKEEVEILTLSSYNRGYARGFNSPNVKGYSDWKEQNL